MGLDHSFLLSLHQNLTDDSSFLSLVSTIFLSLCEKSLILLQQPKLSLFFSLLIYTLHEFIYHRLSLSLSHIQKHALNLSGKERIVPPPTLPKHKNAIIFSSSPYLNTTLPHHPHSFVLSLHFFSLLAYCRKK